ncbi:MAG: hypothetical protein LBS36_06185 [Oscillospiraceae bacterium]|jgi:rod shape-determining protein MreD|nr:hypothetical protein [Oscillospiraceae bacterium]
MPTKEQRFVFYRNALAFAVVVAAGLLQNSLWLPEVRGARAFILLPVVCVTALFFSVPVSFAAGIAAGAVWDIASTTPDGYLAVYLGFSGLLCAVLVRRYMRRSLRTAWLFCFVFSGLFVLIRTLVYASYFDFQGIPALFFQFFLPSFVYTVLLCPVIYAVLNRLYSILSDGFEKYKLVNRRIK